ncbi:MAG: porin [Acidobacteriia bacterium]|nr:porin [Terriglobia bacterium]
MSSLRFPYDFLRSFRLTSKQSRSKMKLSLTLLLGITLSCALPPASRAAEGDSAKGAEDAILSRIDQLQGQLDELRQELAALRTQKSAVPATAVVAPLPATAPSQNLVSEPPQPAAPEKKAAAEPFAFADFTWLTGNPRTKESPIDSKVFTGEVRVDVDYVADLNRPADHTIGGSSEIFRSNEVQVTQMGVGGDFHYANVRGRLMTQFGMYSFTTPRNDASPARGQWSLDTAYRYISEAYGGYHINKLNGINIDAGIFMSYVGLYSYYQFDNWAYQPSYVSSNTPWFFNGLRIQIFPSDKLKIEPWIVNGWQSYGKFNKAPGLGVQILYRPTGSLSMLSNNYWGTDTLGNPDRKRIHTDDSIQVKYYDKPDKGLDKGAFTFTFDAGCEYGGGVSCKGGTPASPSQYFLGFMAYNRFWFHKDLFGFTLGGGAITNPGRYLVLIPPINGATASSGTPYFTANPGDPYKAWDASATFDYMPTQFLTFRWEANHRAANVPYFSGQGGITPPGGNTGAPGSFVSGFFPDLRKRENRFTFAILVKL